jgi:GEVED domain/Pregnancy-associated plasma protein-A
MRNVRIFWILSLLLIPCSIFAQLPCGNTDVSYQQELISQQLIQQYNHYSKQSKTAYTTTYIAVKPHFVRTDAGITNLNMAAFNNAIAVCNQYFINAGIQFYICGTPANTPNYINKTAMYDWNTAGFNRDSVTAANNFNNAHNIYFSNSLGGVGGFSFGMTQSKVNNRTFVLNGQTDDNKTLAHELGHYFNLAHTFNSSTSTDILLRELVTRNTAETSPRISANCSTTGDYVCDTPADSYNVSGGTLSSCNETGDGITAVDANGDHFVPSSLNVMNYYFCSPYNFSTGQYTRINTALAVNNTPNPDANNRYTLDCAETVQNAPTNVVLANLSTSVSLGISITWTDNSSNETGYIIERSTTSSSDGFVAIGGVDANILSFTDRNIDRNVTYYYRVKASNTKANYNTTIPTISTPTICGPLQTSACIANGNINVFKILNSTGTAILDNSNSGCSSNSYGDFTNLTPPTMNAGKAYNFTMKTGYSSGYYPQHIGIWIDANQDNDFDDAGEFVYQSSGAGVMSGTTQIDGIFTIPATANVGNLRLRIRSKSQYDGILTSPCGANDSGESEDYLLSVVNSITVNSSPTLLCPSSNTVSLNFSTNYTADGSNNFSVELSDVNGLFGTTPLAVGSGTTSPITITIPNTVVSGSSYKLRVKGSSPAVTGNESNNFGYGVTTATLSLVSKSVISVGDSSLLRITFAGANPYSFVLSNGKTVSGITTNFYDFYVKPVSSTNFTITSASGGCGVANVAGLVGVSVIPYCVPVYTSACSPSSTTAKIAINRVWLQNSANKILLDNDNSNCSSDNFSDYTNLTAPTLKGDSVYTVNAKGYYGSNGYYSQYFSVWIDYNKNNSFADAGELVWQSPTSGYSLSGTFTMPNTTLQGTTRMRVRSRSGSAPTDPCASYSNGEAEDYTVNLYQLISVGGSVSGSTRICPNTNNNTLTLSGQTGDILKWQSSDNVSFSPATDIANTTNTLNILNIAATKYYRAVVKLSTAPIAYSSVATLTVSNPPSVTSTLVTVNYGNSISLQATGCAGILSWQKALGGSVIMPVSPKCSEKYYAQCLETNGGTSCLTGDSPIITLKVIPSGGELTSIISGNWEASSTWNMGRSPQNGDLVIIRPSDIVTITTATASTQCLEVGILTNLQFSTPTSKLSLGF